MRQWTLNLITRILAVLAFCAALRYVVWRWRRVIDTSYWFSLPFVISEGCLILLGSTAFYFQICKYKRRQKAQLKDLKIAPERWPRVDVMIPCFKEPVEVIEKTVRAALEIDWPAEKLTVLLLDDGGSQEARAMVERLSSSLALSKKANPPSLRYIARFRHPKEPHHAKAGNLNHAIFKGKTSGDYILVLDCDMVPSPQILQALLPHFYTLHRALDPHVAMVQSPQSFSNTLPGDPLNNNSPLFYHVLIPGWDGWDATPCCGTNVVFSRQALTTIGGFTYGSVTEDFLTSMTLKSAGYCTRYVDETLAVGLAPEGLDSFFVQRLRWAVGGLQIFRYFNPMLIRERKEEELAGGQGEGEGGKGADSDAVAAGSTGGASSSARPASCLTWSQRLLYTWSGGHYLMSFPLAVVLCTPFLFLLDDGRLLLTTGTVREYCWHFFPYYILNMTVAALCHCRYLGFWQGLRYLWRSQQEPVFMLFTYIKACLIVGMGMQFGFQVTRKDGKKDDVMRDLANALPHIIFFVIGSACVVTGFLQVLEEKEMEGDLRMAYVINMSWALLVLCGLWVPIGQFWELKVPCTGEDGGGCVGFLQQCWDGLVGAVSGPSKAGYDVIPDTPAKGLDEEQGGAGGDGDIEKGQKQQGGAPPIPVAKRDTADGGGGPPNNEDVRVRFATTPPSSVSMQKNMSMNHGQRI